MDDLKQRFKSFVKKQESTTNIPFLDEADHEALVSFGQSVKSRETLSIRDDPSSSESVQTDDEVLATINEVYYSDSSFDAGLHELKALPETLEVGHLTVVRKSLRRQLQVVSHRLFQLILQKQPEYIKELDAVQDLEDCLAAAEMVCRFSRERIDSAKRVVSISSLGILSNHYKRRRMIHILKLLGMIKTLQDTDTRLRELLQEEDYPAAIQLLLECHNVANTFNHFTCIKELSTKLQDTLELAEEQLDIALSKVCTRFDQSTYTKIQTAYKILGKTQIAMDQLHMHYTSSIHNVCLAIVLKYAEGSTGQTTVQELQLQKKQFPDLCKFVSLENFLPCLYDLCNSLWHIVHSYYRVSTWHTEDYQQRHAEVPQIANHESGEDDPVDAGGDSGENEWNYIKQKLEHGRLRIWQDIQHKLQKFLLANDLSAFKYDQFMKVLAIVTRLIAIGEQFCDNQSEHLHDCIRKQSVNYFKNYHKSRLEEMRMFLENEGWEPCPVQKGFTIYNLQEFSHLTGSNLASTSGDASVKINFFGNDSKLTSNPFDDGFLFATATAHPSKTRIPSSNRVSSDEEVELDGEESPRSSVIGYSVVKKGEPILSSTALNILRLFGKYSQMMSILHPIAFDVLICLSQLFDYYLFSVYWLFGHDQLTIDQSLSNRLRATLKRINDMLIDNKAAENSDGLGYETRDETRERIAKPVLCSLVNLSTPDTIYGLSERIVAVESLAFVAQQLDTILPTLDSTLAKSKRPFLQQFNTHTVCSAFDVRRPVYACIARQAINYDAMLKMMADINWDIKELMSQHNTYVDNVLRELQLLSMRMSQMKLVPPQEAYAILWESCISMINRTFVEGFSLAKKCTNEGRALMQLDFQQFVNKLEKITSVRPFPDKEYVEVYVKAYYQPESQVEDWIKTHKEYSNRQLLALINHTTQLSKRNKQKLIGYLEENEKSTFVPFNRK